VVLDEAQNATSMQMKMFLTRLGEGSRMVITGDRTQVDLPRGQPSGLRMPSAAQASTASASTISPPRTWSATR
jgi:phosphate starvation-inducible protein PhoH